MGQGTYTSMAMLIAEELEVDLSDVHVEHAPPDDQLYGNPLVGIQFTGGSTSVRAFFEPAAPGRSHGTQHADIGRSGDLAGRCKRLPRREGCGDP